jgi:hypothetical protein
MTSSPDLTSTERRMRLRELKTLIERDEYPIDPAAVAAALLRRGDPVALPRLTPRAGSRSGAASPPRS